MGTARNRFFELVLRFEPRVNLNRCLEEQCRLWASTADHPVQRDRTVRAVFKS